MLLRVPTVELSVMSRCALSLLLFLCGAGVFVAEAAEGEGARCWSSKSKQAADLLVLCFEPSRKFSGAQFKDGHGVDFGGSYRLKGRFIKFAQRKSGRDIKCKIAHFSDKTMKIDRCEFAGEYFVVPAPEN